jgi:hypothetical protein
MTRLLAAAALAVTLPFAAFAQDEHAQLRETVAASSVVIDSKVDVAALTDDQVTQIHAIITEGDASDEEKMQRVKEIAGTN